MFSCPWEFENEIRVSPGTQNSVRGCNALVPKQLSHVDFLDECVLGLRGVGVIKGIPDLPLVWVVYTSVSTPA